MVEPPATAAEVVDFLVFLSGTTASGNGLALERRQRLRRDPHRCLVAGARVADVPVGALEAQDEADRVGAHAVGVEPGRHQALHDPGRRLGVRGTARQLAPATVAVLRLAQVTDGGDRRARPPLPRGAERLEHCPGVVGVALGRGDEAEAAVAVLLFRQPRGRLLDRSRRGGRTGGAQGEDAEGGVRDVPGPRSVGRRRRSSSATRSRPAKRRGLSFAAASTMIVRSSSPVSRRPPAPRRRYVVAARPRTRLTWRGLIFALSSPSATQPVQLARALALRGPEAAVAVLDPLQVGGGARSGRRRRCAAGARHAGPGRRPPAASAAGPRAGAQRTSKRRR